MCIFILLLKVGSILSGVFNCTPTAESDARLAINFKYIRLASVIFTTLKPGTHYGHVT
jgi:hypothetical protein